MEFVIISNDKSVYLSLCFSSWPVSLSVDKTVTLKYFSVYYRPTLTKFRLYE